MQCEAVANSNLTKIDNRATKYGPLVFLGLRFVFGVDHHNCAVIQKRKHHVSGLMN